jgi:hypothetical protein
MQCAVTEQLIKQAKTPHELLMFNLFAFHLLVTPLILWLGIGMKGLVLPPLLSFTVIGYIYSRGRRAERDGPWFVMAHWKLARLRIRLLLIAYGITGVLIGLAWLVSLGAGQTQAIMLTVLTRVAVMPTILMVFVVAVLESSAIYQATRGEVPDGIAARYPAPAG